MCRNSKSLALKLVQICTKRCLIICLQANTFEGRGDITVQQENDGQKTRLHWVEERVFILFGHCLVPKGSGILFPSKGRAEPPRAVSRHPW